MIGFGSNVSRITEIYVTEKARCWRVISFIMQMVQQKKVAAIT